MKKCLIVIVLLIGVLSCRTDRTDDYEIKVFNEIFDNLVEEMGALSSFETPPPPIPFLDNNNPMVYDTAGYDKKIIEIERENKKMSEDSGKDKVNFKDSIERNTTSMQNTAEVLHQKRKNININKKIAAKQWFYLRILLLDRQLL